MWSVLLVSLRTYTRPLAKVPSGVSISVGTPAVLTHPTLSVAASVNHRFPSSPATIDPGSALGVGVSYSAIRGATIPLGGVISPTLLTPPSGG